MKPAQEVSALYCRWENNQKGGGVLPESAWPQPALTCTWAHVTAPLFPPSTLSCFLPLSYTLRVPACSQYTKATHTHAHLYILTHSHMLPHSHTHLDFPHARSYSRSLSHSYPHSHIHTHAPDGEHDPRFLQHPLWGHSHPRALVALFRGRHLTVLN